MKVKALRGVCVGIERHLVAGETAELDDALSTFLIGIKAVELVKNEPPRADVPQTDPEPLPAKKPGKKEK